jgi:hypothetical protein
MVDLRELFTLIDRLPREELEQVNRYIQQRRMTTVWTVPAEEIRAIENLMRPTHELTSKMSEEEINAILDKALDEVRRERKVQSQAVR